MKPTILAAALAGAMATMLASAAAEPIELQWWHAMTAVNGERINKIAADFNAAQTEYKVVPVFKGSYAETMTGAIAAYRAGNPPNIVQVFEVGTQLFLGPFSFGDVLRYAEQVKRLARRVDHGFRVPARGTVAGQYPSHPRRPGRRRVPSGRRWSRIGHVHDPVQQRPAARAGRR